MRVDEISHDEYFEYYKQYVDLVADNPLLDALEKGFVETLNFFQALPAEKHLYKYEPGKWTPKDILLHLIDTERVFVYRALYFARHESSSIEGFDENTFGKYGGANDRSLTNLLDEYRSVREATLSLFRSFNSATLKRGGKAFGNQLTVGAIGFIISGHEIHHKKVIQERYL